MKNALFALSAMGALFAAIPAMADSVSTPFDVKVGAYFPYDSGYRYNAGDTFYTIGGDYAFKAAPSNPTDTLGVYADFAQSTGRSYNQYFGVGLQYKSDLLHNGKETYRDPYYALGVGYYWEQETIRESFNTRDFQDTHSNELGGKVVIGVGLAQNVILEGNYTYLPNHGNASGFGADIGLRF